MHGLDLDEKVLSVQFLNLKTFWISFIDFFTAYELIKGLKKRGYRIPEDVSICGFDGTKFANSSQQICSVKIPNRDIGYFATERLLEYSRKRFSSTHHTLLACSIIKGTTVNINDR